MNVGLLSSSSPFSEIALTCSAHIYEHTVHNPSTAICSAFKIRTREEAESFFRESQTNSCSIQRWQTHSRCDTNPPPPFSLLPQPPFRHMRSTFIQSSFLPNIESLGNASQSSQRQKIFLSHASLDIPLMKHEGKKGLHSPPLSPGIQRRSIFCTAHLPGTREGERRIREETWGDVD